MNQWDQQATWAGSGIGSDVSRLHQGFTLLELLVVVALLVLWLTMLVPGFARTASSGRSTQCLNNHRQLAAAWAMYAADNADKLIYNTGVQETAVEIANGTYRNWANNNMDWTASTLNTNLGLLRVGLFPPYLNSNTAVYKCPSDNYVSPPQAALGWTTRARSISMNAYMGPYSINIWREGNVFFAKHRQFLRSGSIPKPASLFLFVDDHPDSINDGYFLNDADPATLNYWGDLPGSLHNGGCSFSFPDGHADIVLWHSSVTRLPVLCAVGFPEFPFSAANAGRLDRDWITSHTTVPLYP